MEGRDLIWGMGWGLFAGAFYAAIAGVVLVAGAANTSILTTTLLLFYLVGGLFAGLVVGVFRRRLGRKRVARMIGSLIALPMGATAVWLEYGTLVAIPPAGLFTAAVVFAGIGWVGGGILWKQLSDSDDSFS